MALFISRNNSLNKGKFNLINMFLYAESIGADSVVVIIITIARSFIRCRMFHSHVNIQHLLNIFQIFQHQASKQATAAAASDDLKKMNEAATCIMKNN